MTARQRLARTPRYDAWCESLRAATDGRGQKTALARHMAAETGQSVFTWQVNLGKILRGDRLINSEHLLAIDAWIQSVVGTSCPKPPQKPRKPTTPHHGRPPATPRQA